MTKRTANARTVVTGAAVVGAIVAITVWISIGPTLDRACPEDVLESADQLAGFEVGGGVRPPSSGLSDSIVDRINEGLAADSAGVLFCGDFADPFAQFDGNHLYIFATNSRGANVPVIRTIDGTHGHELGDALPELPEWSSPGRVWAPAVMRVGDRWVLYYSTIDDESGLQCISVATSRSIGGPYADDSDGPLICPREQGGAIDPSPYVDATDSRFLLWKVDGNAIDAPTSIWSAPLTTDGLEVVEEQAVRLLDADAEWERDLIEGPSMIDVSDRLHLFYSANDWASADYATGHATCETPLGPCVKDDRPWLRRDGTITGLGGLEAFRDGDEDPWVVFHAWIGGSTGYPDSVRALFALPLSGDGEVSVGSPGGGPEG